MDKRTNCVSGRSLIKLNLDYVYDFMNAYFRTKGFFGFMLLNAYSHDSTDRLSWVDDQLYEFLVKFSENELLNSHTMLVLFSDHGPRFTNERKSLKGLFKERNPFFSIFIPDLMKQRYPMETDVFLQNGNKLITPMDIHRTLIDLISLEKNGHVVNSNDTRILSLFQPVLLNRTCKQAGIDDHWCNCLSRTELKVNSYLTDMAQEFINFLNDAILGQRLDLCHRLELDKINNIYLIENEHIKLNKSSQETLWSRIFGSRLLLEPSIEYDFKKYLFQIETKPNRAVFEFTVTNEFNLKQFKNNLFISKDLISRVNPYGNSSHCIFNSHPELRKYCYCK